MREVAMIIYGQAYLIESSNFELMRGIARYQDAQGLLK